MNTPNINLESYINRIFLSCIIILMICLGTALGFIMMHSPTQQNVWRIGITNWPGFDPLYIASTKGFFREQGLAIELVPINSLTDIRKSFERGTIDGYTGTVMDAIESVKESETPHHVVLVTDYSNGGDQLLAAPSITTINDLRGKRVSLEVTSPIARYMLRRALSNSTISEADLDIRSYNQSNLIDQVTQGNLDAVITYEPYASNIIAKRPMNVLFSSADIPEEILDALMVSPAMLEQVPDLSKRLQAAWQAAIDYINSHPEDTNEILARRYNISTPEYQAMLRQVYILNRAENQRMASYRTLHQTIWRISKIINTDTPLNREQISNMVKIWYQKEAAR